MGIPGFGGYGHHTAGVIVGAIGQRGRRRLSGRFSTQALLAALLQTRTRVAAGRVLRRFHTSWLCSQAPFRFPLRSANARSTPGIRLAGVQRHRRTTSPAHTSCADSRLPMARIPLSYAYAIEVSAAEADPIPSVTGDVPVEHAQRLYVAAQVPRLPGGVAPVVPRGEGPICPRAGLSIGCVGSRRFWTGGPAICRLASRPKPSDG